MAFAFNSINYPEIETGNIQLILTPYVWWPNGRNPLQGREKMGEREREREGGRRWKLISTLGSHPTVPNTFLSVDIL